MKKLFVPLLIGSVVLCMSSDLVLAAENQNQPTHWFPVIAWWGQPPPPPIPTNSSSSRTPDPFNPSNAANQNQFTPLQTQSQPQQGWLVTWAQGFAGLFKPI